MCLPYLHLGIVGGQRVNLIQTMSIIRSETRKYEMKLMQQKLMDDLICDLLFIEVYRLIRPNRSDMSENWLLA